MIAEADRHSTVDHNIAAGEAAVAEDALGWEAELVTTIPKVKRHLGDECADG